MLCLCLCTCRYTYRYTCLYICYTYVYAHVDAHVYTLVYRHPYLIWPAARWQNSDRIAEWRERPQHARHNAEPPLQREAWPPVVVAQPAPITGHSLGPCPTNTYCRALRATQRKMMFTMQPYLWRGFESWVSLKNVHNPTQIYVCLIMGLFTRAMSFWSTKPLLSSIEICAEISTGLLRIVGLLTLSY